MPRVSDFKAQLINGGARANQFRVTLNFPSVVAGAQGLAERASFLCKAAQIPASTIEDIPVNYRGRVLHVAGERSFTPWNVTIYNDTSFSIRTVMEQWSNSIQNNATTFGSTNPTTYQSNLIVQQLTREDTPIRTYTFYAAYPVEVGSIALDYEAGAAIETFEVVFVYDYWLAENLASQGEGTGVTVNTPFGSIPV